MVSTTSFIIWMGRNPVDRSLGWRGAAVKQFQAWCETAAGMVEHDSDVAVDVVSEHTSKSIRLPVVRFTLPSVGLVVYARDNFYDCSYTVISERPVGQFDHDDIGFGAETCYYEGFERGGVPIYKHTPISGDRAFTFKTVFLHPFEAILRIIEALPKKTDD
jgi:hypothetical protein